MQLLKQRRHDEPEYLIEVLAIRAGEEKGRQSDRAEQRVQARVPEESRTATFTRAHAGSCVVACGRGRLQGFSTLGAGRIVGAPLPGMRRLAPTVPPVQG